MVHIFYLFKKDQIDSYFLRKPIRYDVITYHYYFIFENILLFVINPKIVIIFFFWVKYILPLQSFTGCPLHSKFNTLLVKFVKMQYFTS